MDFNGKEQGFCRPTPVPQCFNYFPNSTKLLYNSSTNVTTFIKGASDISKIIGNWKCRHGSGDDNPSRTIYVSMSKLYYFVNSMKIKQILRRPLMY